MKKDKVSRRNFLKLGSLGLAGAVLTHGYDAAAGMMGGGGGGGGGMGGGGTAVIDPPPGAAFRDPATAANMSTTPGMVEVSLDVREATVRVGGARAKLLTYNGLFPGPTIRAKKGDMLHVHLKNSLPKTTATNILGHLKNITNLHTHGLHVSPEPPADSMAISLAPGEGYDYEYSLMKEEPGHLNLYHPHIHGTAAEQYWGGLMGALVIEDDVYALAGYEEHIMVLKDITISSGVPVPYTSMMEYMQGREGATVMVNGQVNPVLTMKPGQVQRWRFVNGSNARFYKLSLEGHPMHLAGTDSGLVDIPYQMDSILLSPGERADVLVRAGTAARTYKLLSLPYSRGGMGQVQQVTLLTLDVRGEAVADELPVVVNPFAKRMDKDTSMFPRRTMTLSMGQGRGYINGVTFTDMEHCYKVMSDVGAYEVWEVRNQSGMDHPFHQHVNAAQVLSITGGDPGYTGLYTAIPAMKDVVIVPKWGSITLLVPVMDYTGMAMFHCHIMEHEDIGMMGAWHIMGEGMPM